MNHSVKILTLTLALDIDKLAPVPVDLTKLVMLLKRMSLKRMYMIN